MNCEQENGEHGKTLNGAGGIRRGVAAAPLSIGKKFGRQRRIRHTFIDQKTILLTATCSCAVGSGNHCHYFTKLLFLIKAYIEQDERNMKKKNRPFRQKGKIVLFPNMEDMLVGKGLSALKAKQYVEARDLFEELLQFDIRHPQALYGLAICSVELGDYDRAEAVTEEMLRGDLQNDYDIARLYLTILIQKKNYDKALDVIKEISARKSVPEDMRNVLEQLKKFCMQRLKEPAGSYRSDARPAAAESGAAALSGLESHDSETQWLAIKRLQGRLTEEHFPYIKRFLLSKKADPYMKSLLLHIIKEQGFAATLSVYKFGQIYHLPLSTEKLFYGEFSEDVRTRLSEVLHSENPTLCSFAEQVWRHFAITAYPRPLQPPSVNIWAGACCLYSAHLNGLDFGEERLNRLFHVSMSDIQKAVQTIKEIEEFENDEK